MAITILPPSDSDDEGSSLSSSPSDSSSPSSDSDASPRPSTARPSKRLRLSSPSAPSPSSSPSHRRRRRHHGHIYMPGETITTEPQWMRGHGTHTMPSNPVTASTTTTSTTTTSTANETSNPGIIATLSGTLHLTNKLVSIHPLRKRYTPSIGDLVIGRIVSVDRSRWRVDIAAPLLAQLPLSSINLPGGVLRRRNAADELQMRTYFQEGDLVVAEVQMVSGIDGVATLHTRSLRYGKLRNGVFMVVKGVVRSKRQVFGVRGPMANGLAGYEKRGGRDDGMDMDMDTDMEVALGVNGYVWVSKRVEENGNNATGAGKGMPAAMRLGGGGRGGRGGVGGPGISISNLDEAVSLEMYSSRNDDIEAGTRREMARLCGCIDLLVEAGVRVDEDTVVKAYQAAVEADLEMMDLDGGEGEGEDEDYAPDGGRGGSSSTRSLWRSEVRARVVDVVRGGLR